MKKLYITLAFSIVASINSMQRLTIGGQNSAFTRVQPHTINALEILAAVATAAPSAPTTRSTEGTTARKFSCPHPGCTHTSTWQEAMKRHTITCKYNQHPDKEARTQFKCPHCSKGFSTSEKRNQHTITCKCNSNNAALPEFKCPYSGCTHTSKWKTAIDKHAITCPHNPHPDQEAFTRFKCLHCGKGFTTPSNRNQHLITCKQNQNKGALPEFKCPHPGCTHTSKWKSAMDRHAIVCPCNQHPDQEALAKFKCHHCGKGFPHTGSRNQHEKQCQQQSNEVSPTKRHHAAACSSHES